MPVHFIVRVSSLPVERIKILGELRLHMEERLMQLCEVAAREKDFEKLGDLVEEIYRLLEQREQQLKAKMLSEGDSTG